MRDYCVLEYKTRDNKCNGSSLLATNAVSRSNTEWLHCLELVRLKFGVTYESLWCEGVRFGPKVRVVIDSPLPNCYGGLEFR